MLLKIWVAWAVRLSASSAAEGSLPNILVEDGGDCCGRLICSGFDRLYKQIGLSGIPSVSNKLSKTCRRASEVHWTVVSDV